MQKPKTETTQQAAEELLRELNEVPFNLPATHEIFAEYQARKKEILAAALEAAEARGVERAAEITETLSGITIMPTSGVLEIATKQIRSLKPGGTDG